MLTTSLSQIQSDDVSHLLLLSRRNPSVEPTIFAAELEKFRPYQQRLGQTVHHQQTTIQEITQLWRSLRDLGGRGGARKWDERERRKKETVRRFTQASEKYMEVRDGLASVTFHILLLASNAAFLLVAKAFSSTPS